MPLPALFRAAAAAGASSSTPAASARELQPRATAPAAAGHGVGAIVNVGGTLYVLATHAGNNELHGTAARSGNYYGTNVVDGDSSLGSWSDPALRGEFTWAGTRTRDDGRLLAEGIARARLRLPRSTFTGFPPATLYARLTLGDGGVTYFALARNSDRDSGSGRGGMATGVYAWAAATTGAISSGQPGDRFQVDLFTNAAFSVALPLHTVNVWQPLRSDAAQQRTDAQIEELARDAAGAALVAGGARSGVGPHLHAERRRRQDRRRAPAGHGGRPQARREHPGQAALVARRDQRRSEAAGRHRHQHRRARRGRRAHHRGGAPQAPGRRRVGRRGRLRAAAARPHPRLEDGGDSVPGAALDPAHLVSQSAEHPGHLPGQRRHRARRDRDVGVYPVGRERPGEPRQVHAHRRIAEHHAHDERPVPQKDGTEPAAAARRRSGGPRRPRSRSRYR